MSQLLDHIFCEPGRENRSGLVDYSGSVVTTTSGTLGTGAANVDTPLFTIAKVGSEAGRYRITLIDSRGNACVAPKLVRWSFGLIGTADAAYTAAKGLALGLIRNNLIASAGTFEIQFQRSDTMADAEVEDGATIHVEFTVKKSSATP
jgi:hypothetical protein